MYRHLRTVTDPVWATVQTALRQPVTISSLRRTVVRVHAIPSTNSADGAKKRTTIPITHSKWSPISSARHPKLTNGMCFSQSSSPDNWGGFDGKTVAATSPSSRPDSGNNSKRASKPPASPDFDSIDVKSQKPTKSGGNGGANKTKKIEDDAWDLLNN